MLDLLITGGRVIDPKNGTDGVMTIGVRDGVITQVNADENAAQTIDAKGCIVAPGFIDVHTHLWPLTNMGVQAESAHFPAGITTVVDAGSAGSSTYECHRASVMGMQIGVKVLLNVCSAGLTAFRTRTEYIDPALFDRSALKRLVNLYPNEIVGLKIRMGVETALDMGLEPLKAACELAHEIGLPLVVHCTNPPVPMKDLIDCLGKGDVLVHAYHGHGHTLMEEGGFDALAAARERGVFIDVGDAGWHIHFDIMREALKRGLGPDTISTDMTDRGLFKKGGTFSLLHCVCKWMELGMPLPKAIDCITYAAARELHIEKEAGHLTIGMPADIAIIREENTPVLLRDGKGNEMISSGILRPMATIKKGRIVYRDIAF